jgi:hypothetical protein
MLSFLRDLLTPPKRIIEEIKNKDLVDKIYEILSIENLDELLTNPTFKLYILNVYHSTFDELLNNVLATRVNKQIIAVNVYSYFKDNRIKYKLERLKNILENNDIDILIKNELNEILNSLLYLKELADGKQS